MFKFFCYLEIIHCNKKRIYKCKEITRLENALAFSPRNYAKSSVATKVLMYNSRGELQISFNPIPKPAQISNSVASRGSTIW